jgi:hypothetical protein
MNIATPPSKTCAQGMVAEISNSQNLPDDSTCFQMVEQNALPSAGPDHTGQLKPTAQNSTDKAGRLRWSQKAKLSSNKGRSNIALGTKACITMQQGMMNKA